MKLHPKLAVAAFYALFIVVLLVCLNTTYRPPLDARILFSEIFPTPSIGGIIESSIYWVLAAAMILTIVIFSIMVFLFRKPALSLFLRKELYKKGIAPLFIILFFFLFVVQMMMRVEYFSSEKKYYVGKTLRQKQIMLFQSAYTFAMDILTRYPGKRTARIISDYKFNDIEDMTLHRRFCYFLYPIDVRSHSEEVVEDILIYLEKDNAVEEIPRGYELDYMFDTRNVVAVKVREIR